MFYTPHGFGYGFKTLSNDVEFCFNVDNLYCMEHDRGIRFNAPDNGVDWGKITESLLSVKDITSPKLCVSDCNFMLRSD